MTDHTVQDRENFRAILHDLRADLDLLARQVDEANQRTKAVGVVLNALVASLRPYGYNRAHFSYLVRLAAADLPDFGPESVQHEVLLINCRKVLGKLMQTS